MSARPGRTPYLLVLFGIFLMLKLAGLGTVARWSWWWVVSPLLVFIGAWLGMVLWALYKVTQAEIAREERRNANR